MRRIELGAVALLGLLLAGCGGAGGGAVVGVAVYPWPTRPGSQAALAGPPPAYLSLSTVSRAVPTQLPVNPRQTCRAGPTVQLFLKNGRVLTYGPCTLPASIERLRLVLLEASRRELDRPLPGTPRSTPAWLREQTWRTAGSLGDAHPDRIVVRLNLREHGRLVDRVWMRGRFVCEICSGLGQRKPAPTGRLAGFTVDARTRQLISSAFRRG